MTNLTSDEAKALLRSAPENYATKESLLALVRNVEANVSGNVTILYSGQLSNDFSASQVIKSMQKTYSDIRIIDKTEAAYFLESNEFSNQLARIFDISEINIGNDKYNGELRNWLFDPKSGPWAETSARFVAATTGDVVTFTPFASDERIYAKTEFSALLENNKVTTINGIDRESLLEFKDSILNGSQEKLRSAVDLLSWKGTADLVLTKSIDGKVAVDATKFLSLDATHFSDKPVEIIAGEMSGATVMNGLTEANKASLLATAEYFSKIDLAAKGLTKLGTAAAVVDLLLTIGEANAAVAAGDSSKANLLMAEWTAKFGASMAAGALASEIVGSALAPLYLVGPIGAGVAATLTLFSGIGGSIIGSIGVEGIISSLQSAFHTAENARSPLILDLDGNGVQTISKNVAIHFDHDGNHFAEATGWVAKNDGLLVFDRNGNGKIDDGSELFGNNTNLATGGKAANGFAALADLDSNHDGKIDSNDAAFSQLRIWNDRDSNAEVSNGELLTLFETGISSISTDFVTQAIVDAQGNQHLQVGQFTLADGSKHAIEDVWFALDTARTVEQDLIPVSAAIEALPDLQGFGNVRSLHQAMAHDATGRLQSLVNSFVTETNIDARSAIMTTLMYSWAQVEGIDPTSRTATQNYGNAIGDARKLATLEAFLGEDYLGTWCWGTRDPNPHGQAAPILIEAFDKLTSEFSAKLMAQTQFKNLYDGISLAWNSTTSSIDINVTKVVGSLENKYVTDPTACVMVMDEFAQNLNIMGDLGTKILTALAQKGDFTSPGFSLLLYQIGWLRTTGDEANNTLYATDGHNSNISGMAGNDCLYGNTLNNMLDGGSGNDLLFSGTGNDILKGGTGNDTINAGAGVDTFVFNQGDGQDVINEYWVRYKVGGANLDVLRLGDGLFSSSAKLIRGVADNSDNLTIVFDHGDQITLTNYFDPSYRLKEIHFSDNTTWDYETVSNKLLYSGTSGNDNLNGLFDAKNNIDGGAGDDIITAGKFNDVLAGGTGSDTINAGPGIDTFVFNQGDGQDVINESYVRYKVGGSNLDVLRLGEGLHASTTQLIRGIGDSSDNLMLAFVSGDKITLNNYFNSSYRIQTIHFADGTDWGYSTITSKLVYYGTNGNDTLDGLLNVANNINGGAGDDTITAGNVNDTLAGGAGNDTLYAGVGLNIFIFNKGDGRDIINEDYIRYKTGGVNLDVLRLGEGLFASATQVARGAGDSSDNLILKFGNGDEIFLNNYFDPSYRLQTIHFSDGTDWDYSAVLSKIDIVGSAQSVAANILL